MPTKFVDSIDAIEARYPTNADKVRLWQDFKTYRHVQALKDHEEFRDYLNQKVQWLQKVDGQITRKSKLH